MNAIRLILVVLLALAGGQTLMAQAPVNEQIRFQGRLTDAGGNPVTTSTSVRFRLYSQPTGGTALWDETQTVVPSASGVFTAQLGAVTAFGTLDFGQTLYVGLTFGTDAEMTPRYILTAATRAHFAGNAGRLGGLLPSAYAQLSGATFTGNITAPTFIGSLQGNAQSATSFTGALTGDVTGLQGATVVSTVGGVSAANVASGVTLANAAASANTANAIVRRDASGNFTAGQITATTFVGSLNGNATSATTATTATTATNATNFTGALAGQVTGPQGATVVASVGGVLAANVATGVNLANASTDLNTASQIVRRNASGGFSAGTITATFQGNLTGNVTGTLTGNASTATTASQLLGATWAAPQAIGSTTPSTGAFTGLSAGTVTTTGAASVGGAFSAVGNATLGNDLPGPFRGSLVMHDNTPANAFTGTLRTADALATNRTWSLPDASGTVVLDTTVASFFSGAFVATDGTSTMTGALNMGGQNITGAGSVTASAFVGSGAAITGVNAATLAGQNQAFYLTRANHTGPMDSSNLSGPLPALNGAALTSLTGANVTGSVPLATLATNATTATNAGNATNLNGQGAAFYLSRANHTGSTPSASLAGALPALNGSALTDLTGANVTGAVALATLATNATNAADAALLNGNNATFYLSRANHTGSTPSASLVGALPALNGSALTDLTGANVTGAVALATLATNATNAANAADAALLNGNNASFYLDRDNHSGDTPSASLVGALPALDGSALTDVNAALLGGVAAANFSTTAQTNTAINNAIAALGLGTMSVQNAGAVAITGGSGAFDSLSSIGGLSVNGGTSSFAAPVAVGPASTYTAHHFIGSVDGNTTFASSGLRSQMTGINAGSAEIAGAWLEASGDGAITQGAFGQAVYTGGMGGGTAIGLDGRARNFGVGPHGYLAIGTAGRADDAQLGSNIGVHAWARQGGKSAGLFAVANATEAEQNTFDTTLANGLTAAVLGFNNATGPNAYGLHVTGENNLVAGNLTVTGTLNASVSGTADNALALGGTAASSFSTTAQTSTAIGSAITALNLGTMSQETAADYFTSVQTNTVIGNAITALNLGTMSQETAADYFTSVQTSTAIGNAIAALNLGTMSQETAADYYTAVETNAEISSAITALGLGTMSTQNAGAVAITGGSGAFSALSSVGGLNVSGGNSSFSGGLTSFTATQGTGGGYTGHSFVGSVDGSVTGTRAAGLHVSMTGTNAATGSTPEEVAGAWFQSTSDGNQTQGLMGHATFNGTAAFGDFAVGVAGRAANAGIGGIFAVGVSGSVIESQDAGGNVGVHAYALNTGLGGTHSGLAAFANADIPEQFTFQTSPAMAGFASAAVLAHNPSIAAGHYGLFVGAANNRIDGNLTVTGTLNASVTGTADNALALGGAPASAYALLGGAAFTGGVSAPTFTGNLVGNADTATNATNAANAALLGGNNAAYYLDRANHTGSTPSSSLLGNLPVLDGSALTNLTGANVNGAVALATNATTAATATNALSLGGELPSFYLDATNIGAGTLNDARLSSNVALLDATANAFAGNMAVGGSLLLGVSGTSGNKAEINAVISHLNGPSSMSGESDAGLNVLAITGDGTTERAIALRGRISDHQGGSTATRQLRGVTGAVNTDGGVATSALGGYFFARANAATTAGLTSLSGIAADAQIDAGAAGFGPTSRIIGARFGVADLAATSASAVGVAGTVVNDGSWAGTPNAPRGANSSSTGVFGLATGATSNVGVFGAANASELQTLPILASLPNVGVYAFNPGAGHALFANGLTGFSAPQATGISADYSAHSFAASVNNNGANPARGLFSRMDGTSAGSREVSGAWLEAHSDGAITQGVFGQGWYTGSTDGQVFGLDGRARVTGPGSSFLFAIGTAGRADDTQAGSNIGLHGWAASGGKNAGVFGVANADIALQLAFNSGLLAGTSSALMGYNSLSGANDYGLYVQATNNRIAGNLAVTGAVTAASIEVGSGGPQILTGSGAPTVDAPVGSLYLQTNDDAAVGVTNLWSKVAAGTGAGAWRRASGT